MLFRYPSTFVFFKFFILLTKLYNYSFLLFPFKGSPSKIRLTSSIKIFAISLFILPNYFSSIALSFLLFKAYKTSRILSTYPPLSKLESISDSTSSSGYTYKTYYSSSFSYFNEVYKLTSLNSVIGYVVVVVGSNFDFYLISLISALIKFCY